MKIITILPITMLVCIGATAQTTRIADNNPNRPAGANIFSTVQAAVDAAVPGDIVYVTPSLLQYAEDIVIGKRITMVGVGFGISELGGRQSSVRSINLQRSSNGFDPVSSSVFRGIATTDFNFTPAGSGSFNFENITIENMYCYRITQTGPGPIISNLVIRNSVSGGINLAQTSAKSNILIYNHRMGLDIFQAPLSVFNADNLVITNSLIYYHASGIAIQGSTNVRVEHNIISGAGQTFVELRNAIVANNIFFGQTPGCTNITNTFRDNVFSNNLVTVAGFTMPPTANGGGTNSGVNNLPSGTNPLFTNASVATVAGATADTFDYTLQAGSPCIGTATTGENIGPSGGLYPWTGNLSLKASTVPVITLFGNSGVVPQNQPLKSNIKAKSN